MKCCGFWKNTGIFSRVLLIVLVFHLGISAYVLLWSRGVFGGILPMGDDAKLITYALLSFSLATLIASYHLVVIIFKRRSMADKKLADQLASMKKPAGS
jgi:hypothetical protein